MRDMVILSIFQAVTLSCLVAGHRTQAIAIVISSKKSNVSISKSVAQKKCVGKMESTSVTHQPKGMDIQLQLSVHIS